MEQFQQTFTIGAAQIQLTFIPFVVGADKLYHVHGYGKVYSLDQNEDGGWEFTTGVPEELAMAEDEISCYLEDHHSTTTQ